MTANLELDPVILRLSGTRLAALAEELAAAAARMSSPLTDVAMSGAGAALVRRCDELVAGLRADAEELAMCADRLRQEAAEVAESERAALDRLDAVAGPLGPVLPQAWPAGGGERG